MAWNAIQNNWSLDKLIWSLQETDQLWPQIQKHDFNLKGHLPLFVMLCCHLCSSIMHGVAPYLVLCELTFMLPLCPSNSSSWLIVALTHSLHHLPYSVHSDTLVLLTSLYTELGSILISETLETCNLPLSGITPLSVLVLVVQEFEHNSDWPWILNNAVYVWWGVTILYGVLHVSNQKIKRIVELKN